MGPSLTRGWMVRGLVLCKSCVGSIVNTIAVVPRGQYCHSLKAEDSALPPSVLSSGSCILSASSSEMFLGSLRVRYRCSIYIMAECSHHFDQLCVSGEIFLGLFILSLTS